MSKTIILKFTSNSLHTVYPLGKKRGLSTSKPLFLPPKDQESINKTTINKDYDPFQEFTPEGSLKTERGTIPKSDSKNSMPNSSSYGSLTEEQKDELIRTKGLSAIAEYEKELTGEAPKDLKDLYEKKSYLAQEVPDKYDPYKDGTYDKTIGPRDGANSILDSTEYRPILSLDEDEELVNAYALLGIFILISLIVYALYIKIKNNK
jgi:hypothetical protein